MQKRPLSKVVLGSFLTLWVAYALIQLIDLAIIYSIIIFLYEFFIGNVIIFFNFSFSLLKYSISYLFIFFLLCLFMNMRYKSIIKWKFFGVDLHKYNSKVTTLVFLFKEYNYACWLILNFFLILVLLYYIMHKNFLIIGWILSFYVFIGISIFIKRLLIKKNYFNKSSFNIFINMLLVSITCVYFSEVGDSIEQYVGFKTNWAEFFYGFLNKKDKLLYKVKYDNFNYKWWNIQELYKKQKLSENYIYLKTQIINKNFFSDISNENKKNVDIKGVTQIIPIKIQQKNINSINLQNNNIYTDKNIVYYNSEKYDNQAKLLKNLNYSKCLEHKKLRLYLLNMKNMTAGDIAPRGTRNNLSNIELLLNKDKKNIAQNLDDVLLDENIAKKLNYYLQYKYNQHKFFNILFDKNISNTTKNFLFLKFTHTSVSNLIQQYINIKINIFIKYNEFIHWWENKNYIASNFFKGYNVKKYITLTKYHFKGKQALYNLFNKDNTDNVVKPIKISKIHDVTFKLKLTNYQDRNILLYEYFKPAFNKKIEVFNSRKIIKHNYMNYSDNQFILKKIKNHSYVLYGEQSNNNYLATLNTKIKHLSVAEYQNNFKNNYIYNYFYNKYFDFSSNQKIDKLEFAINNTKTLFSLFFQDNNYNNKSEFLYFKNFYNLNINKLNVDTYSVYKYNIIKIINNLEDTADNLNYKNFLFKRIDELAFYCSSNQISYGQLLNNFNQWKILFNIEAKHLNFKNFKDPYLDKNIYFKTTKGIEEALDSIEVVTYNSIEEFIISEHFSNLYNRINICNLAVDTKLAMLYEDLDAKIAELESNYRYERELLVFNNLRYCIDEWWDDLDNDYANYFEEIEQMWPSYLRMYKDEIYQPARNYIMKFIKEAKYILEYDSYLDYSKLHQEDIDDINIIKEELIKLGCTNVEDLKQYFDKFWDDHAKCLRDLEDFKILDLVRLKRWELDGLMEMIYNTRSIFMEEQVQLEFDIEDTFKSLREFSLKRKEFIKEEQHAIKIAKNNIINKDWDAYNQNRFKNEIMKFKIKK